MNLKEEFIKTIIMLNKKDILLDNKLKVNKSEFMLLMYIYFSYNEICAKNIVQELGFSKSMVANLVSSLEEKNFITKKFDLHDKRKYIIKLTIKGNNFAKSNIKKFDCKLDNLFKKLNKDEIEEYIILTNKIMEVLDNETY